MIIHHSRAGEIFLNATQQPSKGLRAALDIHKYSSEEVNMQWKARHLCRYTLTVDKVKRADHIYAMYNATKPTAGEQMY